MRPIPYRPRGFSLIELMIGMVIAMMGLAAVGSMMATFSKKRSTVTQTMVAQDNGVMALYRLEKDLAQAGYGLMPLQRCTTVTDGISSFVPAAAIITDGGTGSDALQVTYITSDSGMFGAERVDAGGFDVTVSTAVTDPANIALVTSTIPVRSTVGFKARNLAATNNAGVAVPEYGDFVVLAPASTQNAMVCNITRVTAVSNVLIGVPGATSGYLGNLGSVPGADRWTVASNLYAINNTILELTEFGALPNVLVDDIIFMKAQYGLSANISSTTVTSWQSAAPADSRQVVAIRVGLVSRSALRESEVIDAPATLSVLPAVSGVTTVADPASGQCATDATSREVKCKVPDTGFRYRAYSTTVPLRNVMWTRCPVARPDCSPW